MPPIRWIDLFWMLVGWNCHNDYLLFNLLFINYRLRNNKLISNLKNLPDFTGHFVCVCTFIMVRLEQIELV